MTPSLSELELLKKEMVERSVVENPNRVDQPTFFIYMTRSFRDIVPVEKFDKKKKGFVPSESETYDEYLDKMISDEQRSMFQNSFLELFCKPGEKSVPVEQFRRVLTTGGDKLSDAEIDEFICFVSVDGEVSVESICNILMKYKFVPAAKIKKPKV